MCDSNPYLTGKVCPYCDNPTEFIDSSFVYGRSYGMIYICKPCKAWCGVHKGTDQALGRIANFQLREAKKEAHRHFDILWKNEYLGTRKECYEWLSSVMYVPEELCHIGMFDVSQCYRVVDQSKKKLEEIMNQKMNS